MSLFANVAIFGFRREIFYKSLEKKSPAGKKLLAGD